MKHYDRILDYVIEQSIKYDSRNLQYEQDIMFRISREINKMKSNIMLVTIGFTNIVGMQQLLSVYDKYINLCNTNISIILNDKFDEYYNTGYKQIDDIIQLGCDLERKHGGIKEMQVDRDENTIKFIRDHAFELLTGYNNQVKEKLRATLGDLLLRKHTDKATVRAKIESTLGVNRSKAEEITQQELSRAYNYGVLERLYEYDRQNPGSNTKKYWHGFETSKVTCPYCRERIGSIYDLYDDSETLPAHIRCRCVWLPVLNGWDKPMNTGIISRANMLNTGYSDEQIYSRINNRLGINYGEYLSKEDATDYLNGDRSTDMSRKIDMARTSAIKDTMKSFDIALEVANTKMYKEFNTQMGFWRDYVACAVVDNDSDILDKSYEAIKAVMVLPWSGEQLTKWNNLLDIINKNRRG